MKPTWGGIIARIALTVLLAGSLYGVIYPEQLGMTKATAQIVNAVYLSAVLIVQVIEGRRKS